MAPELNACDVQQSGIYFYFITLLIWNLTEANTCCLAFCTSHCMPGTPNVRHYRVT